MAVDISRVYAEENAVPRFSAQVIFYILEMRWAGMRKNTTREHVRRPRRFHGYTWRDGEKEGVMRKFEYVRVRV